MGLDYVEMAPEETRGERMRRVIAAVNGSIIRVTHQLTLSTGGAQFVETVSLPLRRDEQGCTTMACFVDVGGLLEQDLLADPREFARVPDITEIIPIPVNASQTYPGHLAWSGCEEVKMISARRTVWCSTSSWMR